MLETPMQPTAEIHPCAAGARIMRNLRACRNILGWSRLLSALVPQTAEGSFRVRTDIGWFEGDISSYIDRQVYFFDGYEQDLIRVFVEFVPRVRRHVVLDIGANVGAYSLVAFRFLRGKTKVYAFEPGFVTFPQLCRNIYLNGAADGIIPFQVALSDETSVTGFHYQNLLSGGALHALKTPVDQYGKRFHPVFTLASLGYRLDEFVRQFALPVPNHLKIDVDGREYQILRGSEELLKQPELRSILIEVNENHEDTFEIEKLLEKNGLVLHSRRNENSVYCKKDLQL